MSSRVGTVPLKGSDSKEDDQESHFGHIKAMQLLWQFQILRESPVKVCPFKIGRGAGLLIPKISVNFSAHM